MRMMKSIRHLPLNLNLLRQTNEPVLFRSLASYPQLIVKSRPTGLAGSRKSRQLRNENAIPGVVYGVDDDRNVLKRMILVDKKALQRELRVKGSSFENTLYEVIVEDEASGRTSYIATPRQTQLCPLTDSPLSVNFLRYSAGNRLRIPIDFVNADLSQDIKRGSFVVTVQSYLDCVCDGEVPSSITLDLSGARKGDIYRLSSLTLPPKVRPAKNVAPDLVFAVVKTIRGAG